MRSSSNAPANRPLSRFVAFVVAAGVVVGACTLSGVTGDEVHVDQAMIALALGALFSEAFPVRILRRDASQSFDVGSAFTIAALLVGGPATAVMTQILATGLVELIRRRPPMKLAFNLAEKTLTLSAAGLAVTAVGSPPVFGAGGLTGAGVVAFLAAAAGYILVNQLLVATVCALDGRESVSAYFRREFPGCVVDEPLVALLAPLAIAVVTVDPLLLPLLGIPAWGLRVVTHTRERARTDAMKDELIASVSHEFRTPLTAIRGHAGMLAAIADNTDVQNRSLTVIDRNAKRLTRLVEDLLLTAEIRADRLDLRVEPVDASRLVADAVEAARPAARGKGLVLGCAMPDGAVTVDADPERLAQVVDNVLGNAVKFTPSGGHVEARLSTTADAILIEVADTGMGVPEAERHLLFERFGRTSDAIAAQTPGSGLGLHIAKGIVVAHGGEIDVDSAVGVGTTFFIRLPRGDAPPPAAHTPAGSSA